MEVIEPQSEAGSTYHLDDELTVGRSPGCGIPTGYDAYSSTLHARLYRRGDKLWVEDLCVDQRHLRELRADLQALQARQGGPPPGRGHGLRGDPVTVLRSGSATDVGRVRGSNQDLALEVSNLFAVADGMGGHAGGEVAARVAVDALRSAFPRHPSIDGLREAVNEANAAVWRTSQIQSDLRGMGTTLTAAALVAGTDGSRRRRPGQRRRLAGLPVLGRQITQVTDDHSLAEEKVRKGELTEAEAAVHPHRHILTRALGVSSDVDVDLWELHLQDGDRILFCSDGLTNEVADQHVGRGPGAGGRPHELPRCWSGTANEHGGNDNITAVVVDALVGEQRIGNGGGAVGAVALRRLKTGRQGGFAGANGRRRRHHHGPGPGNR